VARVLNFGFFRALAFTEVFAITYKSIKTPSRASLKLTNIAKLVKFFTKMWEKKKPGLCHYQSIISLRFPLLESGDIEK
jgi:hypothetical protein